MPTRGKFSFPDGTWFSGKFKNGELNGNGEFQSAKRSVIYKGGFKNSKFSGMGEMKYNDGSKYIGMYKNGKR